MSVRSVPSAAPEADDDLLQTIAAGTAGHVGEAFFRSLRAREPGRRLTDEEPMVVTWFRLVG